MQSIVQDPKSYAEAMQCPNADAWSDSMQTELDLLEKYKVYEEVDRPKDRKVVGSRWVYKTKFGPVGELDRR